MCAADEFRVHINRGTIVRGVAPHHGILQLSLSSCCFFGIRPFRAYETVALLRSPHRAGRLTRRQPISPESNVVERTVKLLGVMGLALLAGFPLILIYYISRAIINMIGLRSDGVRVSGTSLGVRSEERTTRNEDGHLRTSTLFYTMVRFADDRGVTRTKEVGGAYPTGSEVSMVFHRGRPDSALPTSNTSAFSIGCALGLLLFGLGFLAFTIFGALSLFTT